MEEPIGPGGNRPRRLRPVGPAIRLKIRSVRDDKRSLGPVGRMTAAIDQPSSLEAFLTRWEASGAAERANYALFLSELCDVLGVPRPDPTVPDDALNAYVFERGVPFHNPDG